MAASFARYVIEKNARQYPMWWPMPSCSRYKIDSPPKHCVDLGADLDLEATNRVNPRHVGLPTHSRKSDDDDMDLSDLDGDECVLETLGAELARASTPLPLPSPSSPSSQNYYAQRRRFIIGDDFDDYDGDTDDDLMDLDGEQTEWGRCSPSGMLRSPRETLLPQPLYPPGFDLRSRTPVDEMAEVWKTARLRPVSSNSRYTAAPSSSPAPPQASAPPRQLPPEPQKRPALARSTSFLSAVPLPNVMPIERPGSCSGYVGTWRIS